VKVGDLIEEFKELPGRGPELPVLTLTEKNGFMLQSERFNKRLATENTSKYKVVNRGDIAFNPYLLWAGALAQNTICEAGIISPLYPTFRTRDGHDARFVGRLLLTPPIVAQYDSIAFGSVPRRRRSAVADFLDLDIPPVPPIEDQRRIASILDAADALRSKRRQALARLDDLEQSLAERLIAGTPQADLVPLASVVEGITVGHVGPTSEFFAEGGVPFIRTGNVGKKGDIVREDLRYITPEFHARLRKSCLRAGDLLISRVISEQVRGALVPLDLDGANCANVIVVRPSAHVPGRVLLALLHSPWGQRKLLGRRVGSAQSVVNTSVLQAWEVPVLSAGEMEQFDLIAGKLESVRRLGDAELARLDALFESLQHRAFRGEL